MKESERLRAARKLVEKPENWMQQGYCDKVDDLPASCRFCSLGAVKKVRGERISKTDRNSTSTYLHRALLEMGQGSFLAGGCGRL